MPYEITTEGDYIFTRITRMFGVLTAGEMTLASDAERIEQQYPAKSRVTDLTSVDTFNVDFNAVFALAERRRGRQFTTSINSAIIAVKPIEIGFARMYQTLNDNPQIEIRIVSSLAEAEAWFAST